MTNVGCMPAIWRSRPAAGAGSAGDSPDGVGSYGAPGSGGSLGFADPSAQIGYAYVTSQMGTRLTGDPRDVGAERRALRRNCRQTTRLLAMILATGSR